MSLAARAVTAGSAVAALGAATALANRLGMPRLRSDAREITEPVTVLIPARNEAGRLPALIADLRAQQGISDLGVVILDDGSTDGTGDAALAAIGADERFFLARNDIDPPAGWTGKTAACARLADLTSGEDVLIFLDADIRLAPDALAAAVRELRSSRAALVCPWPEQLAGSPVEHLVQPLLAWSWASTLPVALANRLLRPSMAVACGQFLVFDAAAYRGLGGHTVVADSVTEDLAIARELRRRGHRTTLVAAGPLARTRMYREASELADGYGRWLWSAYGGPVGSLAVGSVAALTFWAPPLAAILGRGRVRRIGLLGYAAAVTARLLARSTERGGPVEPADAVAALAHPLSVAAYLGLSARSHGARRAGTLRWKGRKV
ncbi:glycosyltransferase family 2 protein [Nocardia sp. CDC153]|uniref:glycosyltransferase n=1 Tax=Nocardia sp. CDC153 TaxID=3112167 RepID=UPI002DBDBB99|nr:glycosyltransferase family 2 protein [Nocardia sp. CDC153]MEC3958432.1 glycosyltransferase family 2 protein [Nocardia sp. CDC153]